MCERKTRIFSSGRSPAVGCLNLQVLERSPGPSVPSSGNGHSCCDGKAACGEYQKRKRHPICLFYDVNLYCIGSCLHVVAFYVDVWRSLHTDHLAFALGAVGTLNLLVRGR